MPSADRRPSRPLLRPFLGLVLAGLLTSLLAVSASPADAGPSGRVGHSSERADVRIATFNVLNTLSPSQVTHDIRRLISLGHPTVIGFQERGGTKHAMKAALPAGWRLLMPRDKPGTDLNPIAFDQRVWRHLQSRAVLLTDKTYRRSRGNIAVDQYAVVAKLENRESGHVVRVANFHMPPDVHNKQTGGPNYGHRDRVETLWRMSASVRKLVESTPRSAQFVATCDCNVRADLDKTDLLIRGKLTDPEDLRTNYDAEAPGSRRSIDYVMTQRHRALQLKSWEYFDESGFATDHPGVVARLKESKKSFQDRYVEEAFEPYPT